MDRLMEKVDELVAEQLAKMADGKKDEKADKIWSMMPPPIKNGFILMGPQEWISTPPPLRMKVRAPRPFPATHHQSHRHA